MKFNFSLYLMAVILFSMCAPPMTTLQIIEDPEVGFPTHIYRIGIVDKSMPSEGYGKPEISAIGTTNLEGVQEFRNIILDSLIQELSKSNRFEVLAAESAYTRSAENSNWNDLIDITGDLNCDAIIVLDQFEPIYEGKVNKAKNADSVTVFSSQYNLDLTYRIAAYDVGARELIFEDKNQINRSAVYGPDLSKVSVYDSLPDPMPMLSELATEIGTNITDKISPNLKQVERQYYAQINGSYQSSSQKADALFWNDQSNEAIDIWMTIYSDSSNAKEKGRAALNVALAYESKGLHDQALEWAEKSAEHLKSSTEYVTLLKQKNM